MEQPVAGPILSGAVPGLFGKLPAHGDFIRRGWPDETVDAIDRWLTDTVSAVRASRDDQAFADWMHAAPLWRGYVPAGQLGPHALHVAVAASVDRAGRLFPVVAGVAGEPVAAWNHAARAGETVDAAIYDALAGRTDADATIKAIAVSLDGETGGAVPAHSAWWLAPVGDPVVESDTVDSALLERLLADGRASGEQG